MSKPLDDLPAGVVRADNEQRPPVQPQSEASLRAEIAAFAASRQEAPSGAKAAERPSSAPAAEKTSSYVTHNEDALSRPASNSLAGANYTSDLATAPTKDQLKTAEHFLGGSKLALAEDQPPVQKEVIRGGGDPYAAVITAQQLQNADKILGKANSGLDLAPLETERQPATPKPIATTVGVAPEQIAAAEERLVNAGTRLSLEPVASAKDDKAAMWERAQKAAQGVQGPKLTDEQVAAIQGVLGDKKIELAKNGNAYALKHKETVAPEAALSPAR